jgi:prevent-host-death family protein
MRQIPLDQVAANLQAAVDEVKDRHETLIITQDSEPVAVLVTVGFYQRWLDKREEAFKFYDNLSTWNSPYSEEEVEADIEQAIREVRAEYKAK